MTKRQNLVGSFILAQVNKSLSACVFACKTKNQSSVVWHFASWNYCASCYYLRPYLCIVSTRFQIPNLDMNIYSLLPDFSGSNLFIIIPTMAAKPTPDISSLKSPKVIIGKTAPPSPNTNITDAMSIFRELLKST